MSGDGLAVLNDINQKLQDVYCKRFMEPPVAKLDGHFGNVILIENRIDSECQYLRHPCDPKNYEEQIALVDLLCGSAILRGADVFAPGVVTCTETFRNDSGT